MVLNADGTEIDDDEILLQLSSEIFIVLGAGEKWVNESLGTGSFVLFALNYSMSTSVLMWLMSKRVLIQYTTIVSVSLHHSAHYVVWTITFFL